MWVGCSYWCADSSPGPRLLLGHFMLPQCSLYWSSSGLCRGRMAWWADSSLVTSARFVNCSVLSLSVSGAVLFPQHLQVFEVISFTQAMCIFSVLSLKYKAEWGQGLCFPSLSSCQQCQDRPWYKSSDQYKIIDYVSEWMRVILPDVMSIAVVINIRKHLFKEYL